MRPLALALALALALLTGCATSTTPTPATTTPVSDRVVADTFDRDGGPWVAEHLALCGFCGPDGPRHLFVVFADARIARIQAIADPNGTMTREPNVTYDLGELATLLEPEPGKGYHVDVVVTARLDDRRAIGELGALWDPRAPASSSCADHAETYRYAPATNASTFDATCPVQPTDPMGGYAAKLDLWENETLGLAPTAR